MWLIGRGKNVVYCFFDCRIELSKRFLVRWECTGMDRSSRGEPIVGTETCAGNVWSTTTTWKTHATITQQTCAVVKGFKWLGGDFLQGKRVNSIINGPQWWVGLNCGEWMVQNINASYLVPPTVKNRLCQFLQINPIWTNLQSWFAMKFALEWELRFKGVHYCTGFWQKPHDIDLKKADQAQICDSKKTSTSVFRPSVFT